ncbi:hypothetical protein E05_07460 [Plautia stali symbiont]|nr:hypothetical protein E05_07460 [Plautia stali symbiont]
MCPQRDVAFARSAPAYGRWISWIVVLTLAANGLWLVATNPNFEWRVVLQWFTEGSVLKGLQVTLGLTVVSDGAGHPAGAAAGGLALNEAAYMAEIIRAGLLSVDHGQVETTQAFGMSRSRALRRIIIPQAMRAIIPPTGNQLISMIKATSLVSVIAMGDLLYSVQAVYNRTFEIIPMLMVAVIWYLLITSILNVGQSAIERYYARGSKRTVVVNKRRASSDTALAAARV